MRHDAQGGIQLYVLRYVWTHTPHTMHVQTPQRGPLPQALGAEQARAEPVARCGVKQPPTRGLCPRQLTRE